jgi:hypothetical protein
LIRSPQESSSPTTEVRSSWRRCRCFPFQIGLQYRYQQGKALVNHTRFLDYDKDEDGNLIINKEEAEVVKRVYREYLEGYSFNIISKGLQADGIKTAAGSDRWLASTLHKILRNEKYMGDALLQKTVTTDFLTKKRVVNKGLVPQYYVENNHEAIIPKELFMRVQEEIARRASLETNVRRRRQSPMYFSFRRILLMVEVYHLVLPAPVGMPSRSSPALILSMLYPSRYSR